MSHHHMKPDPGREGNEDRDYYDGRFISIQSNSSIY